MNSNSPDLLEHFPVKVPKRPRKKCRKPAEEANLVAQTSWISSPSPTPDSSYLIIKNDIPNNIPVVFPTIETMPHQLSRLLSFPNPTMNDENASDRSSRLRKMFSPEAQLMKKRLIQNLLSMSKNGIDVEFMIDYANVAFTSLVSFHASFENLYDAVKEFIYHHCELLETKAELEKNGCIHHMLVHKDDLARRVREAVKMHKSVKISLTKTRTSVTKVLAQIDKTRDSLEQLETKLARDNEKVCALRVESDRIQKSYEEAKSEFESVAKEIEEKKVIEVGIRSRQDQAKVSINNARGLLSSIYWNDQDNLD